MDLYPVQLQLSGRLCVVIGGGAVGTRKVSGLLAAGARVRLVEPRDAAPACGLAGVERVARRFETTDLDGALLVFAASDDAQVNAAVAAEARRRGLMVNRADEPHGGDFALPALLRRGELLVAVSSGGGHPGFAAAVRDRLAETLGEEWGILAALARELRSRRLTSGEADAYNRTVVRALLDERLVRLIAARDWPALERHLNESLGVEISLSELDLPLPTDTP